jgi:arabinogalactan endo-1,4-beta-galactosidase
MKYGLSDVAYTINKKSIRADKILNCLKKNNIFDLRFGLNLVTVNSRNQLGNIENLLGTFVMLKSRGFKIHLYLFLSDDISNAARGGCPEHWRDYSLQALTEKLKNDCVECANIFKENSIEISSYTVGNESEWGVCGYRLNDKVSADGFDNDENFEWLRENLWYPTAYILKECCETIKQNTPSSTVLVHSDSIGKESFTYEYFRYLCDNKVNFDAIGLTYNPWTIWDEDYNSFKKINRTINKLKEFGKPIWIVEYCYPNKTVTNGELTSVLPQKKYSYTPAGQTNFHLDFIEFCKKQNVEALFFWRGEHESEDDISNETGIFQDGKLNERLLQQFQL